MRASSATTTLTKSRSQIRSNAKRRIAKKIDRSSKRPAEYGCLIMQVMPRNGSSDGAGQWTISYEGTNDLKILAEFWGALRRNGINIESSFGSKLDEIYGSHLRVRAESSAMGAIIRELRSHRNAEAIRAITDRPQSHRYIFEGLNILSRPGISEQIGGIFAEYDACVIKEIQRTQEAKGPDGIREIGAIHLTLDVPEHIVPRIGDAIERIKAIFKEEKIQPQITLKPHEIESTKAAAR